jgi:hypothetical protein
MNQGLGQAVQQGDWQRAGNLFKQYNRSNNQVHPVLVRRREEMANWLSHAQPVQQPGQPQFSMQPNTQPDEPPVPGAGLAALFNPRSVQTLPINANGVANIDGRMNLGRQDENIQLAQAGPQLPSGGQYTDDLANPQPRRNQAPQPPQAQPGSQRGVADAATQEIEDIVSTYLPANQDRIGFLSRALRNAAILTPDQANEYRKELDTLTGPQKVSIPDFGDANFVYDRNKREYVLDTFQPHPKMRDLAFGGTSVPALYYYSRRTGWRRVLGRSTPTQGTPTQGTQQGATQQGGTQDRTAFGIQREPNLDTPGDIAQAGQEVESARKYAETLTGIRSELVQDATRLPQVISSLNAMEAALKSGRPWVGPGSSILLDIQRAASNIPWLAPLVTDLDRLSKTELFNKLQTMLGAMQTRGLTSRPTQFDFQQLLAASPGLAQSATGSQVLIDYLRQEMRHQINIARMVGKYNPDQLPQMQAEIDKYYQNNPIIITVPAHRQGNRQIPQQRIFTAPVTSQEDYNRVPSGTQYQHPDDPPGTYSTKQ